MPNGNDDLGLVPVQQPGNVHADLGLIPVQSVGANSDLGLVPVSSPQPKSTTPESDKAVGEQSFVDRALAFARQPSPQWLQPFEHAMQAHLPKESMPIYWYGKGLQQAAGYLPEGMFRKGVETYAGVLQGTGEAAAGFISPANIGLAIAAPEGLAGKIIAGTFLGQAIKGTPEQWRALQDAYHKGDWAAIGEHAAGMGASYLPALGFAEASRGGGERGAIKEGDQPVRDTTEHPGVPPRQDLRTDVEKVRQGEGGPPSDRGGVRTGAQVSEVNMHDAAAQLGMVNPAHYPDAGVISMADPAHGGNVSIPIGATIDEAAQLKQLTADAFAAGDNVEAARAAEAKRNTVFEDIQNRIKGGEEIPSGKETEERQAEEGREVGADGGLEGPQVSGGRVDVMKLAGEGGAPPPEPPPDNVTSLKNAQVDKERAQRNLPPLMSAMRRTFGSLWDSAMQKVQQATERGEDHPAETLISQLKDKPRGLSDEENALLLHRKVEVRNQFHKVGEDQIAADARGDTAKIAENNTLLANLSDKLQDIEEVGKESGRETARSLNARKMAAADDFSLDTLTMKARAARGGRALRPDEQADVLKDFKDITARQIALDAYETSPKAEAYRAALRKRIEAYKTGKFPEKGRGITLDKQHELLRFELQRAKDAWNKKNLLDRWKEATGWEKTKRAAIGWRRFLVLSGPRSILKLGSAMIEGQIVLPMRELYGSALRQLPGIKQVAKMAPREGAGFNIRVEAKAISEMYKNLLSDFSKNIKGEKPDFEALYGNFQTLPPELQNFVGYLHSAIKGPLARNEFTRSFEQRLSYAMRTNPNFDPTFPPSMWEIGRQAWMDSSFWRFQNKNLATKVYRGITSMLDKMSESKSVAGSGFAKAAGTALELELPVVTVPTNIIARTFESVFGTALGSVRLANAYRKGIENLKPEQADLIMRNFKTGGLGTGLFLTGFFLPQVFGGFYRPKQKGDDPNKPGFGVLRVGGIDVPAYLQDNPILIAMQFGATVRQVSDYYARKGKEQTDGIWHGFWSAIGSQLGDQPFVKEASTVADIPKAFMKEGGAGEVLGEHARDYLVPQAIQQTATMTDPSEHRYPEGFVQQIEKGIPGLREQLPDVKMQRGGGRRRPLLAQ